MINPPGLGSLACHFLSLALRSSFKPLSHDIHSRSGGGAAKDHPVYNPVEPRFPLKADRPRDNQPQDSTLRNDGIGFEEHARAAHVVDSPVATVYQFAILSKFKMNIQIDRVSSALAAIERRRH